MAELLPERPTEAWIPLGLSEEASSGGATYYLYDNQCNPLGETHDGVNYYFFTDGLGSITDVLDGNNGNTTRSYSYDPWGNVSQAGNGNVTHLRYTGNGFWDQAKFNPGSASLYQIGTRYYDPTTGRWTQQDPVGGTISDPGTANAYNYAGDDPINSIDPSGMLSFNDIASRAFHALEGTELFGVSAGLAILSPVVAGACGAAVIAAAPESGGLSLLGLPGCAFAGVGGEAAAAAAGYSGYRLWREAVK